MKSTVVDESLSSFKPMYCSREYQTSTRLNQQYEKSTLNYTSVNVLVSNYTNKHITFNKGEYIGCLEPAIEDSATSDMPSHAQTDTHSTNTVPPKE